MSSSKKRKVIRETLDLTLVEKWKSKIKFLEKHPNATTPDEVLAAVYLASDGHEDAKLRIDVASLIKAVSEFSGVDVETVHERLKKLHCLGLLAKECAHTKESNSEPLTIVNTLKQMAKGTAEGGRVTMNDQLTSLLLATRDCEAEFRLGRLVWKVFSLLPVFDIIVRALLTGGVWNLLNACNFTPGFTLGRYHQHEYPVKSVGEILDTFEDTPSSMMDNMYRYLPQIHYMEDGAYEIFCRGAERKALIFAESSNVYDVDSMDFVPIAAFHYFHNPTGSYRGFLLACYDIEKKEFQSICIVLATAGFSQALLEERSISLRSKVISIPKQNYQVDDRLKPDVWFEPTEVWEVKAIHMMISPFQRASIGIVDPDKGISLELPRLVRVRADKKPEEATSSVQVKSHPNNSHVNAILERQD